MSIIVSAQNPELTLPFNQPELQVNYDVGKSQQNIKTFLIDNAGYINYPLVGKIKLAGLTKDEAVELIGSKIAEYFKTPPTINIVILNFKVFVLGEVKNPLPTHNEKILIAQDVCDNYEALNQEIQELEAITKTFSGFEIVLKMKKIVYLQEAKTKIREKVNINFIEIFFIINFLQIYIYKILFFKKPYLSQHKLSSYF